MNVEKLKLKARRLEDKGQTQKAIESYLELLNALEGKTELASELSLFNKVGDLYLKVSQVPEAVDMYERAATLYADHGFPNNAIALCNKVLRNAPGRTHIYLKLAQLMVERGFVAEAKQNLLEYADRMQKAGKTDEAFRALKEFADLSPDNEEIRLLLAEQLKNAARTAEAREQLAKLFHEAEASGDQRRSRTTLAQIKAIDPEFDPSKAPKPKIKERKEKSSDLIFLDVDEEYRTEVTPARGGRAEPQPAAPVPSADVPIVGPAEEEAEETAEPEPLEIESTAMADAGIVPVEGLEGLETTSLVEDEAVGAEGVERGFDLPELEVEVEGEGPLVGAGAEAASIEVPDLDLGGFDSEAGPALLEDEAEAEAEAEVEVEAPPTRRPEVEPVAVAPNLPALQAAVADNPDDADGHVALGEALLEKGDRLRGLEELDIALGLFESKDEWRRASSLVDEILRLDTNSVRHHQKRVELAYRTGEKRRLVESYLGLGDALVRSGIMERARMVYQRVLEHDPDCAEALEAIRTLEPAAVEPAAAQEPVAAAAGSDYINLGELILDEEEKDTRMRVEDEEPTGDEERDFQEMLAQFKRGIEANIGEEDWQAHYDLGVAFKEMGLVDEAIAEFQKALRSPAGRLRTAEALGGCFFEKGQFSVAGTVMRRAVETDPSGDEAKIALLYWMGRCEEEMKRTGEALNYYQRVFALDIRFADVQERVRTLSGAEN